HHAQRQEPRQRQRPHPQRDPGAARALGPGDALTAAQPTLAFLVGPLLLPLAHAPNYKLAISCDRPVTRRPWCGSAPSAGSRWGASSAPGSRAAARAATAARNVSGCNTLKILE